MQQLIDLWIQSKNFLAPYFLILKQPIFLFIITFIVYILFVLGIYNLFLKRHYQKMLNKIKIKKNLFDKFFKKAHLLLKTFTALIWINLAYYISWIDFNKFAIFFKLVYVAEVILAILIIDKFSSFLKDDIIKTLKDKKDKEILSLINLWYVIYKIVLISIGILICLNILWIDITPLLASAGLVWFAVAMASQEIIKNFISWIILFIEKPFTVGDLIKLPDGRTAMVEEIWLRMTKLKTYLGDTIFIPNSKLLETIENVRGHVTEKRKLEIVIGLPYGVNVEKARQIFIDILKKYENIDPNTIEIFVDNLADRSVNFKIRADIPIDKYDRKLWYIIKEDIYNEINKAWIGFPFPTYEVLLKKSGNN